MHAPGTITPSFIAPLVGDHFARIVAPSNHRHALGVAINPTPAVSASSNRRQRAGHIS
jgi:hypothetical protein